MRLNLVHLYPEQMNIYGDNGNIAALLYRLKKRNITVTLKNIGLKNPLPLGSFDLLFSGGGQDSQQQLIAPDLLRRKSVLQKACLARIPMLTVCGAYQLFGHYFQPFSGPKMPGLGIFDAYTIASKQRKIGNILIHLSSKISNLSSNLVGFENHSGNTFLSKNSQALGQVIHGFGNNGQDKTEGCQINNAFGGYLHGPLLPKNPHFCDYLIQTALSVKYRRRVKLAPLDDRLEWQAHDAAVKRTRQLHHPLLKYL